MLLPGKSEVLRIFFWCLYNSLGLFVSTASITQFQVDRWRRLSSFTHKVTLVCNPNKPVRGSVVARVSPWPWVGGRIDKAFQTCVIMIVVTVEARRRYILANVPITRCARNLYSTTSKGPIWSTNPRISLLYVPVLGDFRRFTNHFQYAQLLSPARL